jgi:hypothetical protein
MELTVIGSGTGVPSRRRGSPALAVQGASWLTLLDLGSGTLRALLSYGLNFNAVDVLALTHLHPDHVGDLIPFLFATRYALGYTRTQPFTLLAARGFKEFHGKLKEAFGQWLEPPAGLMDLQELSPTGPDHWRREGLMVRSAPTNHTDLSLAGRQALAPHPLLSALRRSGRGGPGGRGIPGRGPAGRRRPQTHGVKNGGSIIAVLLIPSPPMGERVRVRGN